jgi:hypothetical protein
MRPENLFRFFTVLLMGTVLAEIPPKLVPVRNDAGVRLSVDEQNDLPALRIAVSSAQDSDLWVLFPEHVTVVERGKTESQQLYMFRGGRQPRSTQWRRSGQSLEYRTEFQPGIRMIANARLDDDGVRYRYQFTNVSRFDYDMVQAVTDPRMISPYFRDVRLERTYVHHADGFDLLAAETASRLSMTLGEWLPNRYRVPYTWPIDSQRIIRQVDGVTWYNKSRPVDEPLLATQSTDGQWTIATFSYDPGNLWVNPELTCQHADPRVSLRRGETRSYELKTLILRGSLETVLAKARQQRSRLQH